MRFDRSSRVRLGIAFLLLLALAAAGEMAVRAVHLLRDSRVALEDGSVGPDRVGPYERRFAELREALPARGVVGYVNDAGNAFADLDALQEYFMTQYSLAPVIVVNSVDLPLVVGNLSGDVSGRLGDRFRVLHDFGSGVVLLSGESR